MLCLWNPLSFNGQQLRKNNFLTNVINKKFFIECLTKCWIKKTKNESDLGPRNKKNCRTNTTNFMLDH